MRKAEVNRKTKETDIKLSINLDGSGSCDIKTGIGFFDHMLTALAFHSGMDMVLRVVGDLEVDNHHTAEDVGIALGQAIKAALQDKKGIARFADCFVPMDEALAFCAIDISGRGHLEFNAKFTHKLCGGYETDSTKEFFGALALNMEATLHLSLLCGSNDHHKIEAIFKAFARALRQAKRVEGDIILSSKGVL